VIEGQPGLTIMGRPDRTRLHSVTELARAGADPWSGSWNEHPPHPCGLRAFRADSLGLAQAEHAVRPRCFPASRRAVDGRWRPGGDGPASGRQLSLVSAGQPMTLTFSAWGPFWPWVMSNSTFCPSCKLR
jgi:hypothetical protein